ncbi:psaD [Symbiodinium natans]|uniref:PsaD protein n=1 Tax=Symbiodinium natans TaxID=878477 RepID=A0A812P8N9_9DINO|nr:psaD [Symbiodinium natans]
MSSMPRSMALLGVGAALTMACTAFVAPTSGQNRLRVRAQPQADFGASAPSTGATGLWTACSMGGVLLAVGAAVTRRAESKEVVAEAIPRPEDLLDSPKFPMFEGGTGGYMSRSTRERHAITWTAKGQFKFEMPTGGFGIMNKGENLCYFRKKEQCIALGKQLRKMKIENYKIYRLKKDGTVIFMHPADGVFPEKVNKGRVQVNGRPFTIGGNPQQADLKFTKYQGKSYEADPLTTMFVKARVMAFADVPNLFALPQPNMDELVPAEEVDKYTKQEYTTRMMEAGTNAFSFGYDSGFNVRAASKDSHVVHLFLGAALKRVQDDRAAKAAKSL